MTKFPMALAYTLPNEGGWTVDSGGWTMWGIVVSDVAKHRGVPEASITEHTMRNLSQAEAAEIYQEQYWNPLKLDSVNDLGIATCIFDTAVNRGVHVGAVYAQRVCNISGAGLVIDGKFGLKTLAALNQIPRSIFISNFEALEMAGYHAIIAHNPAKYARYQHGWEARAKRLLTLI